jgi:hypothetical protein
MFEISLSGVSGGLKKERNKITPMRMMERG